MEQPGGMAGDFSEKAMTLVTGRSGFHGVSLPTPSLIDNTLSRILFPLPFRQRVKNSLWVYCRIDRISSDSTIIRAWY